MKQTWRWFGPADTITIPDIRQTGASGIVSALHHLSSGEVWPVAEIDRRKAQIEEGGSGLTWDVVESLPVSEAIKSQTGPVKAHLDAYRDSLRNLAACGIKTVCYNFMPILDWTRTALHAPLPNGGTTMRFDLVDFALFDVHLLKRDGAARDYSAAILAAAEERLTSLNDPACKALVSNIVAGLPGANERWTLDDVRTQLALYNRVTADRLRGNLIDFLSEVVPTAETLGLRLCCHPDDPPFPLLGLPRVMSTTEDYLHMTETVNSPANGVTLCTGSLGVNASFDPVGFVEKLGPRIHFVHLRNTRREGPADRHRVSFQESEHLDGDTDMVATVRALLAQEQRRRAAGREDWQIPMRPDHGQMLLSDLDGSMMPGYPLVGRLRGLAELRGVMAALG